ncbi:MAG: nitrous oxide reductase family maturation protein NosD, partial [Candidatus Hodarchaeota archaeon]
STHNTISNNEIYNNNGDGVYLDHSNENTISGNAIHHNSNINRGRSIGHGIWLNPSLGNTIIDNDVYANDESGIGLLQSNETIIADNFVHNNGENGVSLQYSNDNLIDSNIITLNGESRRGRSIGHGIWLNPSQNNVILNNTVINNQGTGITLLQSSNTTTYSNTISDNALYGINITIGADDNAVALNNFLNNYPNGTSQAIDDGADNLFLYNHWNDHDNTDGDGNNIADNPYPIDGNANSEDIAGVATVITKTGDFVMPPIIIFPNYHDKVTEFVDVYWLMAIDSRTHDLTYDFWYSPDAGKTWILEATGLTETNYLWDTNNLKSGSRYQIKIVATCTEGESAEAISCKFEIFKVKKPGFPKPDNRLPATDQVTTTTSAATAGSVIIAVLSMGVVISIRRFKREF